MTTYLHAIDGRIRARLPEIRGNRRGAARLRADLRTLSGVTAVTANPLTGSVLVEYDSDALSADAIFDVLNVQPPTNEPKTGALLKTESVRSDPSVRDVLAEKLLELAAERLLLALLA